MNPSFVYQSLRQELLETYSRQVNLVVFSFTVVAAIIGYGVVAISGPGPAVAPASAVFLLPLIILCLLMVQLNNSVYTIFTISTYIRSHIELHGEIPRWETDISYLRAFFRSAKPFFPLWPYNPVTMPDSVLYAGVAILMGFACAWLSWKTASTPAYEAMAIAAGVIWFLACFFTVRPLLFIGTGDYEAGLEELWAKLLIDKSTGDASGTTEIHG